MLKDMIDDPATALAWGLFKVLFTFWIFYIVIYSLKVTIFSRYDS